ncbi:hypothetical protein M6B38_267855 [Iris pallida]|uniref:Uncharacterized protein n=1 Tax=Iris pallida TaxID=29817 RepID=A0AAX6I9D3_IRIPA|nr:hypothetical protein M6B38_329155 [Iris pallida]KAJ6849611.1 hypothetical protein M6B38_267855 [Iris pallida]
MALRHRQRVDNSRSRFLDVRLVFNPSQQQGHDRSCVIHFLPRSILLSPSGLVFLAIADGASGQTLQ